MLEDKKAIHVSHVGENWEVEDDKATLGRAETRAESIELAAELAPEAHAREIQIHTSDGRVAKKLAVDPVADAKENGQP